MNMKLMNLLENVVSVMKWLGVLVASFNHQDSRWVAMGLSDGFWLIQKLMRLIMPGVENGLT